MGSNSSNAIMIVGYPCHLEMIAAGRERFMRELKFSPRVVNEVQKTLDRVRRKFNARYSHPENEITFVGVHNRRSDYLRHMKKLYRGGHLLSKKYFEASKLL